MCHPIRFRPAGMPGNEGFCLSRHGPPRVVRSPTQLPDAESHLWLLRKVTCDGFAAKPPIKDNQPKVRHEKNKEAGQPAVANEQIVAPQGGQPIASVPIFLLSSRSNLCPEQPRKVGAGPAEYGIGVEDAWRGSGRSSAWRRRGWQQGHLNRPDLRPREYHCGARPGRERAGGGRFWRRRQNCAFGTATLSLK